MTTNLLRNRIAENGRKGVYDETAHNETASITYLKLLEIESVKALPQGLVINDRRVEG